MYAKNLIHAFPIIDLNLNLNCLNFNESDNQNEALTLKLRVLKVSKSRKQNTKFSHTPKNQNFVDFLALASKKWLKQKIKAIDDLN